MTIFTAPFVTIVFVGTVTAQFAFDRAFPAEKQQVFGQFLPLYHKAHHEDLSTIRNGTNEGATKMEDGCA